jgi:hypothetical protein
MAEKETTDELLDSRVAVYGDRVDNMVRVAEMWSAFLGQRIQPWQVPVMFTLYKIYRIGITPDYGDNVDDVDGYMQIFREVIGEDMVNARTTDEYRQIKEHRLARAGQPWSEQDAIQQEKDLAELRRKLMADSGVAGIDESEDA